MKSRWYWLTLILLLFTTSVFAQSAVIRGESAPGVYENLKSTGGVLQALVTSIPAIDPCQSSAVVKSSVVVNITTATTTALVVPSGSTTIYVCAVALTISQVITTANTFKFIQGTGAACVTAPSDLTGLFGGGGITATSPIVISHIGAGTLFKTNAAGGLCATTIIGLSGNFHGVVTYVQQ